MKQQQQQRQKFNRSKEIICDIFIFFSPILYQKQKLNFLILTLESTLKCEKKTTTTKTRKKILFQIQKKMEKKVKFCNLIFLIKKQKHRIEMKLFHTIYIVGTWTHTHTHLIEFIIQVKLTGWIYSDGSLGNILFIYI